MGFGRTVREFFAGAAMMGAAVGSAQAESGKKHDPGQIQKNIEQKANSEKGEVAAFVDSIMSDVDLPEDMAEKFRKVSEKIVQRALDDNKGEINLRSSDFQYQLRKVLIQKAREFEAKYAVPGVFAGGQGNNSTEKIIEGTLNYNPDITIDGEPDFEFATKDKNVLVADNFIAVQLSGSNISMARSNAFAQLRAYAAKKSGEIKVSNQVQFVRNGDFLFAYMAKKDQ